MAAIAAASFGFSLMIFFGYKDWSFYSPIPRARELLAGGILAYYTAPPEGEKRGFAKREKVLAMLGVEAVIFAATTLNKDKAFPGLYALLPVLGAVLIILSPNSRVAGVEYISAWHTLCNSERCITRVGPSASDVITTDRVHLSNAGSNFLIERIRRSLFPKSDFNQE